MLTLLRQISLRHLYRSPLRSALVVFGIALGVAMYVATNAANASIAAAFDDMIERIAGRADLVVVGRGGSIPGEVMGDIADLDDVAHAAAVVEVPLRESKYGEPFLVLGVDFLGDTHFLPFDVEEGENRVIDDPLAFVNDPRAVLVSRTLAERRGVGVGGELEVMSAEGPKKLVVRGILDDSGLGAAFGGQVAIMFIDAVQVSFARGTNVDRIDVALEEGADVEAVKREIVELAGSGARVEPPSARVRRVQKVMEPFHNGVFLSGFVALIVGMFLIYNAVGIAVAQRRREIGILRAVGVTRARAVLSFCVEAALLAVPGIALGVAVSPWAAAMALEQTAPTVTQVFMPIRPPPPVLTPDLVARGVAAGLMTTVVAALWPAVRAARVNPVESLRPAATASPAVHVPYGRMLVLAVVCIGGAWAVAKTTESPFVGACGILLNAVGTLLLIPAGVVALHGLVVRVTDRLLGVSARLGIDNVERTLGRSALNVAALMAAVSMSVSVGGWLTSLQNNVRMTLGTLIASDIQITAGSPLNDQYNVPFSPAVINDLKTVPGVEQVIPARVVDQDVGDRQMRLVGIESRPYLRELVRRGKRPEILSGNENIGDTELFDARRIVINEAASRAFGVAAGGSLDLDSPSGTVQLEVRAVYIDYSETPLGYLDRKHFVASWLDESVDNIDLVVAADADLDATMDLVKKKIGANELLFVTKSSKVTDEVMKVVDQAFSYARSIEIVTLLIALLGVVATMTAAVLDRVREIGMLRAIGARRRQIVVVVVTEAAFLGFAAAATGVAAGAIQGALLLTVLEAIGKGLRLVYVFPFEAAARIAILVVVTAALAGVIPGRRASKMDVKEALAYE